MIVYEHCAVDLDRGDCSCKVTLDGDLTDVSPVARSKADDFWLKSEGRNKRYFAPRNGAAVLEAGTKAPGQAGCAGSVYTKQPLRVDGMLAGTYICVRTNEGRYSELRMETTVAQRNADRVMFSYLTFER